MMTFEELLNDAVAKSRLSEDQQRDMFKMMINRTSYHLRELEIEEVEPFISACKVIADGNSQKEAGLLDVALSMVTLSDNFLNHLEDDSDEEQRMGTLAVCTIQLHMRYVIELSKIYLKQKKTIDSLSLALNACKGGSDEA